MEEMFNNDSNRLKELEKIIEKTGVNTKYNDWNYYVYLIDYEENYHEEAKVSFVMSLSLIREYARLLLADHDYRYTDVEVTLGGRVVYKDFRYDKEY